MPATPQEALHLRITRLYFRMLLPLSGVTIALSSIKATPEGKMVLLPIALIALVFGLLHWRIANRHEDLLRLVYAFTLVFLVSFVALLGLFISLPGDSTQITVLYLFVPITVFAWGFLFFNQPRMGISLSFMLSLSASTLLWRWNEQGIQPTITSPSLLLFTNLVVLYYNSLVLDLNRQFIDQYSDLRQDALTGLMNRRSFVELPQYSAFICDVAVLDVDHFKDVNDIDGHLAGDRVLRAIGDILFERLNGVGEAYRWGGEEFVILRPQASQQDFIIWLEVVRAEIASRSFVNNRHVTISAGVSQYGVEKSLSQAFAEADQALLQAKRQGRNRIEVHLN